MKLKEYIFLHHKDNVMDFIRHAEGLGVNLKLSTVYTYYNGTRKPRSKKRLLEIQKATKGHVTWLDFLE